MEQTNPKPKSTKHDKLGVTAIQTEAAGPILKRSGRPSQKTADSGRISSATVDLAEKYYAQAPHVRFTSGSPMVTITAKILVDDPTNVGPYMDAVGKRTKSEMRELLQKKPKKISSE